MYRWHSERNLMLHRWRQEIANHEDWQFWNRDGRGAALPPVFCDVEVCHCYRGPGFMRKRRPHGCSRVGCCICKPHKNWDRPNRHNKKAAALRYEFTAEGL